jgi:hypothetical protein
VWLPVGYNWVIWNHGDTTVHLSAGTHQISLSTTGANGAATHGDAIINKIDLQLDDPAVQDSASYEAEQASLDGATTDYRPQGQSGAGAADIRRGQSATSGSTPPRMATPIWPSGTGAPDQPASRSMRGRSAGCWPGAIRGAGRPRRTGCT